jgi:hypothetical protein
VACGSSSTHTVTKTVVAFANTAAAGGPTNGAHPAGGSAHGAKHQAGTAAGHSGTAGTSGTSGASGRSGSAGPGGASAGSSSPARHIVDDIEKVQITGHQGPFIIEQGVVNGTPIGSGTIVMRDRLTGGGVTVSFTVRGGGGSVRGIGQATLEVQGPNVSYHGTARLVGGTGTYRHVQAAHLTVTGNGSLSGATTLHVTGVEWY